MFVALPLLAFVELLLLCGGALTADAELSKWRMAFVLAATLWGVLLAALTEALSVSSWLHTEPLAITWVVVCLVLGALLLKTGAIGTCRFRIRMPIESDKGILALVTGAATIVAMVGVVALVAAPGDTDSMKYHLMRVVHWMQDGNVTHFPTDYIPQLYQPPWSEFVLLHLQLLSGGDRFSNTVEWFAFAGTGIATSLIAQELGARARGQAIAAVCALTAPVAILQGSTAQNSCVVTFWIAAAAVFLLTYLRNPVPAAAIPLGAASGLALLTKGTAYIFLAPFALWWAVYVLRTRTRSALLTTGILASIIIALNAPYMARNIELFGQPLGPESMKYVNRLYTPAALLLDVIRNLSLQTTTPFIAVNRAIVTIIERLHSLLGVAVSDPRITWHKHAFYVNSVTTWESTAGNPLHLVLVITALLAGFAARLRRKPTVVCYMLAVIGGFLLFSFCIKWQPWSSRLQLPFFALASPVVGLVLEKVRLAWIGTGVAVCLLIASLPWVVANQAKPLLGSRNIFSVARFDQYFVAARPLEPGFAYAGRAVESTGCSEVGFYWGNVAYRYGYLLWISLRRSAQQSLTIQDVFANNTSASLLDQAPFKAFRPCVVVEVDVPANRTFTFHGIVFTPTGREWPVVILQPGG